MFWFFILYFNFWDLLLFTLCIYFLSLCIFLSVISMQTESEYLYTYVILFYLFTLL